MDPNFRRSKGFAKAKFAVGKTRTKKARVSGTTAQAIRTGGWADPSRMGELKFLDQSELGTSLALASTWTTPGVTRLLNGCAQGAEATQRIGRKIVMTSLYLRAHVRLSATSTQGGAIRMVVVYDKQTNATAPAVTDIFFNDTFLTTNNLSNRDRFVTLVDKVFPVISAGGDFSATMEVYKKINLETMFNSGSTGAVGDITSGSMYILFAQSGEIATAGPVVNWRTRIRFRDN